MKSIAFFVVAFSLLLLGCTVPQEMKPELSKDKELNELFHLNETNTENNDFISAKVGEEFSIKLFSNPSTGYSWEPKVQGDSVEFVSSEPLDCGSGEQIAGRGCNFAYKFKALKAGNSTVAFSYRRLWEKGVAPINETSFLVKVE